MRTLYLFTVLAAFVTVLMCQLQADMEKLHKLCMNETNLTEAEIKQFFGNGMKASDAKDNMKCHTKCLMEKQGIIKDGIYVPSVAIKQLMLFPALKGHETEVTQAVNNCKNEKGANTCDTAFKITMCIKEFKSHAP
ncbi:general odorant-binding protein 56h-like [Anastrepha obliqua]|uniref:general odorant-binding protein 56h-like n=1 Tax=Anastrepha obliqua TaxID=95512 RepID=UPI0024096A8B|nr:general odorant-binding protein 56h-like [Anastrepha obliqua]